MDISEKLLQYRYHITIAVALSLCFSLLLYANPRILTILVYFWPLFASTTVFVLIIIAFGGVSELSTQVHGEEAGQVILDYIAARRPEHVY